MPDPLSRSDKIRLTKLGSVLLDWYAVAGRDFPWRRAGASVYERVCVEVLLQRTRAGTVAAMHDSFFQRFPTWSSIADASPDQLEGSLKPIGLWRRRATSIRGLARYAVAVEGRFPGDRSKLEQEVAIGQYVASAILLFAHGRREPLLDVNMARVLERAVRPRRLADIRHDPWLQDASRWLLRRGDPVKLNWAMLDLGAAYCKARAPACSACPARRACVVGRASQQSDLSDIDTAAREKINFK